MPGAQAQADAVNLLAGAKTQSNPESCVGVLSMAGKVPKMLVTPTPDLGKVLNSMHGLEMDGAVHFSTGVQARRTPHRGRGAGVAPPAAASDRRSDAHAPCGCRLRRRLRCWR